MYVEMKVKCISLKAIKGKALNALLLVKCVEDLLATLKDE
jgi:hypothetical protein